MKIGKLYKVYIRELWKVESLDFTPWLAKQNNWSKTFRTPQGLTETNKFQIEYWTGLKDFLQQNSKLLKPTKPLPQSWYSFALGKSGFGLSAILDTVKSLIRVDFNIYDDFDKNIFDHFYSEYFDKSKEIFGETVIWKRKEGKKSSEISILKQFNIKDRNDWLRQFDWFKEHLEKLISFLDRKLKIYKIFNEI